MVKMQKIPTIFYGTAWKKDRTAKLVEQAILTGFRGIDTACQPKHYEEAGVGEAIRQVEKKGVKRNELFLQTKFTPINGQDPKRIPYDPKANLTDQVKQSFETSQRNLGSDFIDSLILHSPLAEMKRTLEVWKTFELLFKEKLVGNIGISNCYDLKVFKLLYENAEVKPKFLQNRFYSETNYDRNLRKFCNEKKVIYQSFWTLTANDHILNHPKFQAIAKECKKTEAQILFRYLTQIGIVPLIGTTSEKHMKDDLAVLEFNLNEKHMQTIESLF
jgi:diketogulonate reductase-like aldo/keto reductase